MPGLLDVSTVNIDTAVVAWRSQLEIDSVNLGGGDVVRGARPAADKPAKPYHHGALRAALLAAAEQVLMREGMVGLTLRAVAREVGASHAAPKNHFDDLTGLLSELAAVGFDRLSDRMLAAADGKPSPQARLNAIGHAYVAFAIAEPGLFQLMFRGERLDTSRPALKTQMERAYRVLTDAVAAAYPHANAASGVGPEVVRAWSMVHGFAMLLLDGQLEPILADRPAGRDTMALLDAMLSLDSGPAAGS
jgi:AcrR family transcriptional regulator